MFFVRYASNLGGFRPWRVQQVSSALLKMGIRGITVSDVRGFGAQGGSAERQAGSEFSEDNFVVKVKLEIVVEQRSGRRSHCKDNRGGKNRRDRRWQDFRNNLKALFRIGAAYIWRMPCRDGN